MAIKQDNSRKGIQNILLGIVIALAMFAGFYVFYYTPTNKKIESTSREVAEEEKSLVTVRRQAPLLKPMTEKVKLLEQQLELYRAKLAKTAEVISLIKTIDGEAQRLGLKVMNMQTLTEIPSPITIGSGTGDEDASPVEPAYAKIVLDSDMQADYYKLENFLNTLQNLESFVMIDSMDVVAKGDTGSELTLSFKMSMYSVKGDDNTYVAKK